MDVQRICEFYFDSCSKREGQGYGLFREPEALKSPSNSILVNSFISISISLQKYSMKADIEQLGGLCIIMTWKSLVVLFSIIMRYSIVGVALTSISMHFM